MIKQFYNDNVYNYQKLVNDTWAERRRKKEEEEKRRREEERRRKEEEEKRKYGEYFKSMIPHLSDGEMQMIRENISMQIASLPETKAPLYEYYFGSDISLIEIISDYFKNFYSADTEKSLKVIEKVMSSNNVTSLYALSTLQHKMPTYMDFLSALKATLWFRFQSNKTKAYAVLIAADLWDKQVNSIFHTCSSQQLRNNVLKIFEYYHVYGLIPDLKYYFKKR